MKIAFVGEAYGADEEREGRPFVGAPGRLLRALCHQVGIDLSDALVTNVFNLRPPGNKNDLAGFCGSKAEGIPGKPYLVRGKYVRAEYASELVRLREELDAFAPNLVVALGATPTWALLDTSGGIKQYRGAPAMSSWGYKVLPTYHPSAVLRDYTLRPILIADLAKAKEEAEFPAVVRPAREVWIDPTLADIDHFITEYIIPNPRLSVDIETKSESITCIGFAPTPHVALVIPFWDATKPDGNYWPTLAEELAAWDKVRYILSLGKEGVFHNGMYDLSFMWRTMGLTMPSATHDTMLLHHALQPEMLKSLGFLATLYTDEVSWKFMRHQAETTSSKMED